MIIRDVKKTMEYGDKRTRNFMEHEGDGDTYCNWCARRDPQRVHKGAGRVGNRRTSRDHPNYGIVKIGENTKNRPEDLTRFGVTQTPMNNYQLTMA